MSAVERIAGIAAEPVPIKEPTEAMIARRIADLTAYQDAGYARRYADLMARVDTAAAAWRAG